MRRKFATKHSRIYPNMTTILSPNRSITEWRDFIWKIPMSVIPWFNSFSGIGFARLYLESQNITKPASSEFQSPCVASFSVCPRDACLQFIYLHLPICDIWRKKDAHVSRACVASFSSNRLRPWTVNDGKIWSLSRLHAFLTNFNICNKLNMWLYMFRNKPRAMSCWPAENSLRLLRRLNDKWLTTGAAFKESMWSRFEGHVSELEIW